MGNILGESRSWTLPKLLIHSKYLARFNVGMVILALQIATATAPVTKWQYSIFPGLK